MANADCMNVDYIQLINPTSIAPNEFWREMNYGKGITPCRIARIMNHFDRQSDSASYYLVADFTAS